MINSFMPDFDRRVILFLAILPFSPPKPPGCSERNVEMSAGKELRYLGVRGGHLADKVDFTPFCPAITGGR
jgi:hypothetical protein